MHSVCYVIVPKTSSATNLEIVQDDKAEAYMERLRKGESQREAAAAFLVRLENNWHFPLNDVLKCGCTPELPRDLLKILEPRPHPRWIKAVSWDGTQALVCFEGPQCEDKFERHCPKTCLSIN